MGHERRGSEGYVLQKEKAAAAEAETERMHQSLSPPPLFFPLCLLRAFW